MKRVAIEGSIAFTSVVLLTACAPVIPDNVQGNPTLQTPVSALSPSAIATTSLTATLTIETISTAIFLPASQFTPIPSFTTTAGPGVEIPATAADFLISVTDTPIIDIETPFTGAATPLESVSLDKLSSNTLYKPVHIQNNSGKQIDINFQCTPNKGMQISLEYYNVKNLFANLPEGNYIYVIYVGGRQLSGGFSLMTAPKLFITIYKDRVVVQ
jgi:hypothetical protein